MNVPLLQQVISEIERCQEFNLSGSWTRWIGMLRKAGEGAQTVITGDEGKPMSMMELISDAPCEPEPYIDYLIAHYTGYREATWPESKRGALVEADCVMIQIDHFLIQLDDIKRKMHRPLAASSARAGSERQERAINAEANEYARMFDRIAKMHSFDLPMALLAELIGLFETALSRDAVPPASQQDEQLRANLKRLMASWRRTASQMPHDGHERYIRSVYAECADNLEVAIKPAASVPAVAAPSVGVAPQQDRLVEAAKRADWMQVVLNQGPPCFHLEDKGNFCLRAERWAGHGVGEWPMHKFVSLADLLRGAALDAPEQP
jgi:hypothetical protein